jgi:hypothetical protein
VSSAASELVDDKRGADDLDAMLDQELGDLLRRGQHVLRGRYVRVPSDLYATRFAMDRDSAIDNG